MFPEIKPICRTVLFKSAWAPTAWGDGAIPHGIPQVGPIEFLYYFLKQKNG